MARVHVPSAGIIPKGDKDAILNSIVETYRSSPASSKDHHRKKYKGKPRSKIHKISKWMLKRQAMLPSPEKHLDSMQMYTAYSASSETFVTTLH
jgi:hypothetical protein